MFYCFYHFNFQEIIIFIVCTYHFNLQDIIAFIVLICRCLLPKRVFSDSARVPGSEVWPTQSFFHQGSISPTILRKKVAQNGVQLASGSLYYKTFFRIFRQICRISGLKKGLENLPKNFLMFYNEVFPKKISDKSVGCSKKVLQYRPQDCWLHQCIKLWVQIHTTYVCWIDVPISS